MKVQYFSETDTLYIEFKGGDVVETRDLDEDTLIDVDSRGRVCGITLEHAKSRTDVPQFSFEEIIA